MAYIRYNLKMRLDWFNLSKILFETELENEEALQIRQTATPKSLCEMLPQKASSIFYRVAIQLMPLSESEQKKDFYLWLAQLMRTTEWWSYSVFFPS